MINMGDDGYVSYFLNHKVSTVYCLLPREGMTLPAAIFRRARKFISGGAQKAASIHETATNNEHFLLFHQRIPGTGSELLLPGNSR